MTDAQFRATFAGYVATVDMPGCMHWEELLRVYPGARVILTVRDPSAWFDSCCATIFQLMPASGLMPFGVRNAHARRAHARSSGHSPSTPRRARPQAIRCARERITHRP